MTIQSIFVVVVFHIFHEYWRWQSCCSHWTVSMFTNIMLRNKAYVDDSRRTIVAAQRQHNTCQPVPAARGKSVDNTHDRQTQNKLFPKRNGASNTNRSNSDTTIISWYETNIYNTEPSTMWETKKNKRLNWSLCVCTLSPWAQNLCVDEKVFFVLENCHRKRISVCSTNISLFVRYTTPYSLCVLK